MRATLRSFWCRSPKIQKLWLCDKCAQMLWDAGSAVCSSYELFQHKAENQLCGLGVYWGIPSTSLCCRWHPTSTETTDVYPELLTCNSICDSLLFSTETKSLQEPYSPWSSCVPEQYAVGSPDLVFPRPLSHTTGVLQVRAAYTVILPILLENWRIIENY